MHPDMNLISIILQDWKGFLCSIDLYTRIYIYSLAVVQRRIQRFQSVSFKNFYCSFRRAIMCRRFSVSFSLTLNSDINGLIKAKVADLWPGRWVPMLLTATNDLQRIPVLIYLLTILLWSALFGIFSYRDCHGPKISNTAWTFPSTR